MVLTRLLTVNIMLLQLERELIALEVSKAIREAKKEVFRYRGNGELPKDFFDKE